MTENYTSPSRPHALPVTAQTQREARKVAVSSFIGTTIEWYDFFLYGACAALVFGPQFFPTDDPLVSQLASLSTLAVAFIVRPLGGVIAGHLGDRIGRKRMLVVSLLMMGIATTLIGLLPTYAMIGVAAPILLVLMRVIQGLAVAAEWGGAASMAVEFAPPNRRGLYGMAPQLGAPAGAVIANSVVLVASTTTQEGFVEWGWRIGFLLSFVLLLVGIWIRRQVQESPLFLKAQERGEERRLPLIRTLRDYPLPVVKGIFLTAASTAIAYVIVAFTLSYGTTEIGYPRDQLLVMVIWVSAVQFGGVAAFSILSDRIGRRKVFIVGSIGQVVVALFFFTLFDSQIFALAVLVCSVGMLVMSAQFGPLPAILSETFPTTVRFTGISLSYQFGTLLGGGLAPVVSTALLLGTGTPLSIGIYLAVLAVLATVAMLLTPEGRDRTLE